MKIVSRLMMGLASVSLLASCGASPITPDQAKEIAAKWSIAEANKAGYSKVTVASKGSSHGESKKDYAGLELTALITALVPSNQLAVTAAALIEGTEFKANGNALEFAYGQGDNKYEYKINEHGLTTWAKTIVGSEWEETSYSWSK